MATPNEPQKPRLLIRYRGSVFRLATRHISGEIILDFDRGETRYGETRIVSIPIPHTLLRRLGEAIGAADAAGWILEELGRELARAARDAVGSAAQTRREKLLALDELARIAGLGALRITSNAIEITNMPITSDELPLAKIVQAFLEEYLGEPVETRCQANTCIAETRTE